MKPHKVSTSFVQAQNFSSATSHRKTHPEDIKTDSSAKKKKLFSLRSPPYSHVPTSGSGSSSEHEEQVDPQHRPLETDTVWNEELYTTVELNRVISNLFYYSLILLFTVQSSFFSSFSRLAITVSDFTLGFFSGSQTGGQARTRGPNLYRKESNIPLFL